MAEQWKGDVLVDGDIIPSPTTWRDYCIPGSRFAEIMRMIGAGMTDEEIAARYMETDEKLEAAAQTIAVYRKVHDGKLTPPEGTPFRHDDKDKRDATIMALRQMGRQVSELAEIFGLSGRRVRAVIQEQKSRPR